MTNSNQPDRNEAGRTPPAQHVYDAVVAAYINDISGRRDRREESPEVEPDRFEMDLEAA